jgi:5-methylcytosine-specific restriction endonuclease McrA
MQMAKQKQNQQRRWPIARRIADPSAASAEAVKALHRSGIRAYYASSWWRHHVRPETLRRADYTCQRCHRRCPLDVHHLHYSRMGHEGEADVMAVCRDCHGKVEKGSRAPVVTEMPPV